MAEENEEKKKAYNKWKSRRWLITLWSMLLITFIVVFSLIKNASEWVTFATTLVAIPVAYTTLESINKRKPKQEKIE